MNTSQYTPVRMTLMFRTLVALIVLSLPASGLVAQRTMVVEGDLPPLLQGRDDLPFLHSHEIQNASRAWQQRGLTPRCSDPTGSPWPQTGRIGAVLTLMTSATPDYAKWDFLEIYDAEDEEGAGIDMAELLDHPDKVLTPHIRSFRNMDAFSIRGTYVGQNRPYWGFWWTRSEINLLPGWFAAASTVSVPDALRQKWSGAYCMDEHGNLRLTTSRDDRVDYDEAGLVSGLWKDDRFDWHGTDSRLEMLPKPTGAPLFPMARVLPKDPARAIRQADSLFYSPRNSNLWQPLVTRWDLTMAPYIVRQPARVFPNYDEYLKHTTGRAADYRDDVIFEVHARGRLRKHTYTDNRLGGDIGQVTDPETGERLDRCNRETEGLDVSEPCEPGYATEARVYLTRVTRLKGWDPLTRWVVAATAGSAFSRGRSHAVAWVGDQEAAGFSAPSRTIIDLTGPEMARRAVIGCGRRTGTDCESDNPLMADSIIPLIGDMCPTGYVNAVIDPSSGVALDWDSDHWTHETYKEVAGCTGGQCGNAAPVPDGGPFEYVCRRMTEVERGEQAGGVRGDRQLQGREERIRCRREGNCPQNNLRPGADGR